MTEISTKALLTVDVASMTTGYLLGEVSGLYAVSQHMLGGPVMTHQLDGMTKRLTPMILRQHPGFPTTVPGAGEGARLTREQIETFKAGLIAKYGETIDLVGGDGSAAPKSPFEGIPEHLRDKTTVVIVGEPAP